jgi:membrane associated rhomboid family serine protease
MPRGSPQFATPPVTPVVKAILIASGAVFLIQFALSAFAGFSLSPFLGFVPMSFLHGWIWQPFTYSFLHADPFHIIFNMLSLWFLAGELEQIWGTRTFTAFFFICALGAALTHGAVALIEGGTTVWHPLVGSSGAIYGILLAYGILFGDRTMLAFMMFPMQARYFVMILGAMEFMTSFSRDGISHLAHLGGMLTGFVFLAAMAAWRKRARLQAAKDHVSAERKKRLKKANHLRLVNGDDPDDDDPKTWN